MFYTVNSLNFTIHVHAGRGLVLCMRLCTCVDVMWTFVIVHIATSHLYRLGRPPFGTRIRVDIHVVYTRTR